MIRDTNTPINATGIQNHANTIDAELSNYRKSLEFALQKMSSLDDLIAYYETQIARLEGIRKR